MINGNGSTTRGVVEIELGGRQYKLTPTWQALDEIESGTGQGIGLLVEKAMAGATALSFHEQAVIIAAGIRATGREEATPDKQASTERVKPMLFAEGVYTRSQEVRAFILATVSRGQLLAPAPPGKEQAEEETADSLSADT